jgi:hypothetical protein
MQWLVWCGTLSACTKQEHRPRTQLHNRHTASPRLLLCPALHDHVACIGNIVCHDTRMVTLALYLYLSMCDVSSDMCCKTGG